MLDTKDICCKFGTTQQYDVFCKEWAKACYRLNPTEKNKERMEYSKKAYAVLGVQNE